MGARQDRAIREILSTQRRPPGHGARGATSVKLLGLGRCRACFLRQAPFLPHLPCARYFSGRVNTLQRAPISLRYPLARPRAGWGVSGRPSGSLQRPSQRAKSTSPAITHRHSQQGAVRPQQQERKRKEEQCRSYKRGRRVRKNHWIKQSKSINEDKPPLSTANSIDDQKPANW